MSFPVCGATQAGKKTPRFLKKEIDKEDARVISGRKTARKISD
jgi:hypothetical protein